MWGTENTLKTMSVLRGHGNVAFGTNDIGVQIFERL